MLISLVEIKKQVDGSYTLETVFVNPKHVSMLREDFTISRELAEGRVNLPINKSAGFTRLTINSDVTKEITVIGTPSVIETKFFNKRKMLLRG